MSIQRLFSFSLIIGSLMVASWSAVAAKCHQTLAPGQSVSVELRNQADHILAYFAPSELTAKSLKIKIFVGHENPINEAIPFKNAISVTVPPKITQQDWRPIQAVFAHELGHLIYSDRLRNVHTSTFTRICTASGFTRWAQQLEMRASRISSRFRNRPMPEEVQSRFLALVKQANDFYQRAMDIESAATPQNPWPQTLDRAFQEFFSDLLAAVWLGDLEILQATFAADGLLPHLEAQDRRRFDADRWFVSSDDLYHHYYYLNATKGFVARHFDQITRRSLPKILSALQESYVQLNLANHQRPVTLLDLEIINTTVIKNLEAQLNASTRP